MLTKYTDNYLHLHFFFFSKRNTRVLHKRFIRLFTLYPSLLNGCNRARPDSLKQTPVISRACLFSAHTLFRRVSLLHAYNEDRNRVVKFVITTEEESTIARKSETVFLADEICPRVLFRDEDTS